GVIRRQENGAIGPAVTERMGVDTHRHDAVRERVVTAIDMTTPDPLDAPGSPGDGLDEVAHAEVLDRDRAMGRPDARSDPEAGNRGLARDGAAGREGDREYSAGYRRGARWRPGQRVRARGPIDVAHRNGRAGRLGDLV